MSGCRSVPILTYHRIGPPVPPHFSNVVTPHAFAGQMAWLSRRGYVTISLDDLLAARQAGGPLPRRSVVLTFDDGFADCVQYALPVLQRHGYTATFFLVAGLVGGRSLWHRHSRGADLPLLTWGDARRMVNQGFTCGAHSLTHPLLTELDTEPCKRELAEGRALLEERLQCPVRHLAYPYGGYDGRVRSLAAEAGYATACSTRPGRSSMDDDALALPRIDIPAVAGGPHFALRVRTGYGARDGARLLARRVVPHPLYALARRVFRSLPGRRSSDTLAITTGSASGRGSS